MADLLQPGSGRAAQLTGDDALVAALAAVEVGWATALRAEGLLTDAQHADVAAAAAGLAAGDLDPAAVEAAGNPVLPLVQALRAAVTDPDARRVVHRGLTSQDVLDSALMLLGRDAVAAVRADLRRVAAALAGLAAAHHDTVMAGRTLTQHAVPVTFGLVAAQWLVQVLDADDRLAGLRLPVQVGGAAGTLSLATDLLADPEVAAATVARELGLQAPGLPWHTRRTPLTRLGDALVETLDVLGLVAGEVLLLGRPEIGEVREAPAPGRGGSSTMPHKQNPVLAVLVRSAALQAPLLGAQLHASAAQSLDQRPDGAWHAEWPALRRLLGLAVTAAAQAAELVAHLEVRAAVMADRAEAAADALLAERGPAAQGPGVASYVGQSGVFVDRALARHHARLHDHHPDPEGPA